MGNAGASEVRFLEAQGAEKGRLDFPKGLAKRRRSIYATKQWAESKKQTADRENTGLMTRHCKERKSKPFHAKHFT
jgi:hypothetical protein